MNQHKSETGSVALVFKPNFHTEFLTGILSWVFGVWLFLVKGIPWRTISFLLFSVPISNQVPEGVYISVNNFSHFVIHCWCKILSPKLCKKEFYTLNWTYYTSPWLYKEGLFTSSSSDGLIKQKMVMSIRIFHMVSTLLTLLKDFSSSFFGQIDIFMPNYSNPWKRRFCYFKITRNVTTG